MPWGLNAVLGFTCISVEEWLYLGLAAGICSVILSLTPPHLPLVFLAVGITVGLVSLAALLYRCFSKCPAPAGNNVPLSPPTPPSTPPRPPPMSQQQTPPRAPPPSPEHNDADQPQSPHGRQQHQDPMAQQQDPNQLPPPTSGNQVPPEPKQTQQGSMVRPLQPNQQQPGPVAPSPPPPHQPKSGPVHQPPKQNEPRQAGTMDLHPLSGVVDPQLPQPQQPAAAAPPPQTSQSCSWLPRSRSPVRPMSTRRWPTKSSYA